jgi:hypothetical protein
MNYASQKLVNELTAELFVFLDDCLLSMQKMLGNLNELRAAVVRRDQKTLGQMSDDMPELTALRDSMQQRQRQICQAFAGPLNCPADKINMSYLALFLEPQKAKELKTRQRLLQELVGRLSKEHGATQMLLRECERLNRAILDGIVGKANQTCTYGSAGRVQRQLHCSILSTRI